jgi:hypothetical protein
MQVSLKVKMAGHVRNGNEIMHQKVLGTTVSYGSSL